MRSFLQWIAVLSLGLGLISGCGDEAGTGGAGGSGAAGGTGGMGGAGGGSTASSGCVDGTLDVDVEAQRWILRMLPQLGDLISELAVTRHQALTRLDEIASLAGAHRSDLNNLTRKNAP